MYRQCEALTIQYVVKAVPLLTPISSFSSSGCYFPLFFYITFPFLCWFISLVFSLFFKCISCMVHNRITSFLFPSQLALTCIPNFVSFALALVFSSLVVAELAATHLARLAHLVPLQLRIRHSVEDPWKPNHSISALSRPCSRRGFVFVFRHGQCSVSTSFWSPPRGVSIKIASSNTR